ncbi:MAG: FN3 associated domain-containing protein [Desulfotomaculaceae bacterium]|nr:FN3 associated domain-containing protein [Desulfotomaculaceae bacterium]
MAQVVHSRLFKCFGRSTLLLLALLLPAFMYNLTAPATALAAQTQSLEITGDGVAVPLTFTLAELAAMEQYEHVYSTINTWPTKRWYTAKGVNLRKLLDLAGLKEDVALIRFVSGDGYDLTLTAKELLEDNRYYFPGLREHHPNDGSIPGSSADALEVEPILALQSVEGSDDPGKMNDRDALLLVIGQRAVTEQTNNLFLKYVSRIEALTATPEKWDSPKANIPSETVVPMGTKIELSNKHSNEDKIHYTTDGSTPTVHSPMFNWSASRWWDLRDDLEGINQPIEVKEDTVIKMITIGPGKEDSDVVTFTFTADLTGKAVDPTKVPGGPPTGVTLDRSTIDLPIGGSLRLTATITPFNAADQRVTWRSNDTRVATVDNRGLVTVVGPGTAVITVTAVASGHTAACVVNRPDEEEGGQVVAPPVTASLDHQPPEREPPPAEKDEIGPETTGAPPGPPLPEERLQYLAKREDLAAGQTPGDAGIQQEDVASQVFEMSADTVPLPLKIAEDHKGVYAATILLFFFLLGAVKGYAEYLRER